MKWKVPAKTFFLGEYAAIAGSSAIILATTPYFELEITANEGLIGIHPESPAGLWWQKQKFFGVGLTWHDPHQGRGGLGASSAQFIASYLASCHLQDITPELSNLLEAYYQSSWTGKGLKPSGYDVIAQMHHGCIFINKQTNTVQTYSWPFEDLSFTLVHTGVKLATHYHLQEATLPAQVNQLSTLVDEARLAFEQKNSDQIIYAVNKYHNQLSELNLVAEHSLKQINLLKKHPEIAAIKGCGALGADVLLIVTKRCDSQSLKNKLLSQNWIILATEEHLAPN